jgi:predicted ester cyclase
MFPQNGNIPFARRWNGRVTPRITQACIYSIGPKLELRRLSMSETNKAVIRSFVHSVNAQNWDRLRILLVPNFIRHSNAAGAAQVRSAEELITYLKGEYVTFPDAEETLLDLVAEGESVAVRSQFRGTQVGSMGSYPPSNKVLSATVLAIYRLERGRIAEAWVEWDNLYGLEQLGQHPAT